MTSNQQIVSVSQVNNYIKAVFDGDENLRRLYVSGEISNFKKHYPSGHLYFSLKDSNSVIRAVMFSSSAKNLTFELKDGMSVIVCGRISCYEATGQYQIYVEKVQPEGIGSVYLAFEQLKNKLASEGLFDEQLKKPLPSYPERIGVVTSRTGAVIHDIQTVAEKRYPLCEILLYPTEVQGEKAEKEIIKGIEYFNKREKVDVIIVGRGGGSIEDLWVFNKEGVARAVVASKVPVISAVGHETDFTICDFVADRRAATPSAATEIALPDINVLKAVINDYENRLKNLLSYKINNCEYLLKSLIDKQKLCNISGVIDVNLFKINRLSEKLNQACRFRIDELENRYKLLENRLHLCSEEVTLKRGFVRITSDGGVILGDINDIRNGMEVNINFHNGRIRCKLEGVKMQEDAING